MDVHCRRGTHSPNSRTAFVGDGRIARYRGNNAGPFKTRRLRSAVAEQKSGEAAAPRPEEARAMGLRFVVSAEKPGRGKSSDDDSEPLGRKEKRASAQEASRLESTPERPHRAVMASGATKAGPFSAGGFNK